ncbi:MAG: hypothetical protein HKO67_05430 [Flavobacteriaceae bacterium]|nr:hypothetical protein [Bacteroidia bacterium]NNL79906.1 hypothetical protein [Flavobacteriaceae bacterium]
MTSKILITSVGSMVAQNILETLKYRRQNLFIIGTDASADAPLYDCDKVFLVPDSELPPSDFSEKILQIIKSENPDVIIPGRDIDVIILGMLKSQNPELAHKFVVGNYEIAKIVEDKWASYLFSMETGLPFADSILYDSKYDREAVGLFIKKHGFPLILKPRKGFASRSVSLIVNEGQLANQDDVQGMILQEYLGSPEVIIDFTNDLIRKGTPLFYTLEDVKYSLQLFIDRSGGLKDSLVTLHKMKNGVSGRVDIHSNHGMDDIITLFHDVFAKKGWYGPLNVQFQKSNKTNELKAYEINARYTGATAARYILGYDEVGFALSESGIKLAGADPIFNSQKSVLKQTYISERPDHHIAALNRDGVWERK